MYKYANGKTSQHTCDDQFANMPELQTEVKKLGQTCKRTGERVDAVEDEKGAMIVRAQLHASVPV